LVWLKSVGKKNYNSAGLKGSPPGRCSDPAGRLSPVGEVAQRRKKIRWLLKRSFAGYRNPKEPIRPLGSPTNRPTKKKTEMDAEHLKKEVSAREKGEDSCRPEKGGIKTKKKMMSARQVSLSFKKKGSGSKAIFGSQGKTENRTPASTAREWGVG